MQAAFHLGMAVYYLLTHKSLGGLQNYGLKALEQNGDPASLESCQRLIIDAPEYDINPKPYLISQKS